MRHIAIIGSGPAGFYAAEAALKAFGADVQVDIIDRLPTPYGLIRAGVAPDHQSIKAVYKRYEAVARDPRVMFLGHVSVGGEVSVAELGTMYDALVLATGAPRDRPLGIPGEELPGVMGSAAFVGWYNGHPDFADHDPPLPSHVAVIGNGNVAIDVARILAKTEAELAASDIAAHAALRLRLAPTRTVRILGRRGPHQVSFTPKEMGELGQLARAQPHVDAADLPPVEADAALEPGLRKTVGHLRAFAAAPARDARIDIRFEFFSKPVAIEGEGRAERLVVERTRLDGDSAVGTGELRRVPAGLVVACIGYRTSPIAGVPFDERAGRFVNDGGRIGGGLYATGWARRGPSGTIGTNRTDAQEVIGLVAADLAAAPAGKPGRAALVPLLLERGHTARDFADWDRIDAAEIAAARPGSPREKFVRIADMLGLLT